MDTADANLYNLPSIAFKDLQKKKRISLSRKYSQQINHQSLKQEKSYLQNISKTRTGSGQNLLIGIGLFLKKKCHFLLDKWWLSIRFQVKQLTPENIFEMTDTRHIRRYLDECHITFENPKRDVKKFFQNFFHANPDYLDKINKLFQEEMRVKKNHAKLFLLFSTLIDRSQFKEKIEKGKKLGITYSVKTAGDSNENFEKSKKLAFVDAPPYFPGMLLWLEAHVPDFDSSPTK